MTQQPTATHIFAKSSPLMAGLFKAALVAGPILFAAAPSEAVTVKTTVNGFTGQFAPANWTTSANVPGNTVVWQPNAANPTTLRLVRGAGVATNTFAQRNLDAALFAALKPVNAGRLVGYTYKYDWAWTFTNTGSGGTTSTNSVFAFKPLPTPSTALNTSAPLSGTWTDGSPDTVLGAIIERTVSGKQGTGAANISNFQFVAEYDVPGPLPLFGAAAAFAWSRKLRNRLKVSNELC